MTNDYVPNVGDPGNLNPYDSQEWMRAEIKALSSKLQALSECLCHDPFCVLEHRERIREITGN